MFKRVVKQGTSLVVVSLMLLLVGGGMSSVTASGITFANIGPHEYDLPVNFEPFNAVVQYGWWNDDDKVFASNRETEGGGGTDTFVGLTKYARFWTVDALPDVGFGYLVTLPEIAVHGDDSGVSGLGDPITGPFVWIKPTENSTLGFQSFIQAPFGSDELSNHAWNNYTSFFWDWNVNKWNIDGHAGAVFKSDREYKDSNFEQGTTMHASLRVAYRWSNFLEPMLAIDYETTGSGKNKDTGARVSGSDELAIGPGISFYFTPTITLNTWYSKGVDGRNCTKTDAFNFKFTYIF